MNKTAFCMVILGANMILSIFLAAGAAVAFFLGFITWIIPVILIIYAFLINEIGILINKREEKKYAKTEHNGY